MVAGRGGSGRGAGDHPGLRRRGRRGGPGRRRPAAHRPAVVVDRSRPRRPARRPPRMPRAASRSRSSASSTGAVCENSITSRAQLAEQQRLVHRHRRCSRARRSPGRAPPSRGSTGSAARRDPSARAARACRAARRPARWSTSSRRAAHVRAVRQRDTAKPPSCGRPRSTVPVDRPRRRSRRTSARPARQQLARAAMPSRASSCGPLGRRVARLPGVDHQHRAPRPGQRQRPAEPGGSAADHHHVVGLVHGHLAARPARASAARRRRIGKLSLPKWQTDGMDDSIDDASTPSDRGCGAAPAARGTLAELSERDRHLGQHAVPVGVRASAGRPWSCCCRWPGPTGSRSTNWSTRRRPATRGSTSSRSPGNGMTMLPLTRRAGGIQAFKLMIPPAARPATAGAADPRGLRVAVRARRPAAAGARRARPRRSTRRRGGRVRHPGAALVRRRRRARGRVPQPVRPRRASAPTCELARRAATDPAGRP